MKTKYHTKVKYNKYKLMLLPDVLYKIKKNTFSYIFIHNKAYFTYDHRQILHASYNMYQRFCCN